MRGAVRQADSGVRDGGSLSKFRGTSDGGEVRGVAVEHITWGVFRLRNSCRHFDRLDDRRVVIFRLVDPGRDRPHPHGASRERPHQFARIRLAAQPAGIVARRKDQRHAIVDVRDQFVPSREAEAIFLSSGLTSTANTEPRCPRNSTALSLSVPIHSLTAASSVAEATNSPSGSKATRLTGPDFSSPNVQKTFSSTFHNAMCGLGI